jgi:hypothetical protein
MLTRLSTVAQDVLIRAAGIFQGVSQDGHAVEGTVVVDGLGETVTVDVSQEGSTFTLRNGLLNTSLRSVSIFR